MFLYNIYKYKITIVLENQLGFRSDADDVRSIYIIVSSRKKR